MESCRSLWQLISAKNIIIPDELIVKELKNNKQRILDNTDFFSQKCVKSKDAFKKDNNITDLQAEFLNKLVQLLHINFEQAYIVYKSYLFKEFSGNKELLMATLSNSIDSEALCKKMFDYFLGERIYLLNTLHLVLSNLSSSHCYQKQFNDFMQPVFANNDFIDKVISNYKKLCVEPIPSIQSHGRCMKDSLIGKFLRQNLKEKALLLEIMFLYFNKVQASKSQITNIITIFKNNEFGCRILSNPKVTQIFQQKDNDFVNYIAFLQSVLLVKVFEMKNFNEDQGKIDIANLLKSSEFELLRQALSELAEHEIFSPLYMLCSCMARSREIALGQELDDSTMAYAEKALSKDCFSFLYHCLNNYEFVKYSEIEKIIYNTIYNFLQFFYHNFEYFSQTFDLLGNLLSKSYIVTQIWNDIDNNEECIMHSILLHVIRQYPMNSSPLQLLGNLAMAGPKSCAKTINKTLQLTQITTIVAEEDLIIEGQIAHMQHAFNHQLGFKILPTDQGKIMEKVEKENGTIKYTICWNLSNNLWNLLHIEVIMFYNDLLSHTLNGDSEQRMNHICYFLRGVMTSAAKDPVNFYGAIPLLGNIIKILYSIFDKYMKSGQLCYVLMKPLFPILRLHVQQFPPVAYIELKSLNILPDQALDLTRAMNTKFGEVEFFLTNCEIAEGTFQLTSSMLDIVLILFEQFKEDNNLNNLLGYVDFITEVVVQNFRKWNYACPENKPALGIKCIKLYMKIMDMLGDKFQNERHQIHSLIADHFTRGEAGNVLCELVCLDYDSLEISLTNHNRNYTWQQIELFKLSCEFLNRIINFAVYLDEINEVQLSQTSIYRFLTDAVHSRRLPNAVQVLANFIKHEYDSAIPVVTTKLLTCIAMHLPMSIMPRIGEDAENIKNVYIARLTSVKETEELKLAIVKLLSSCLVKQPEFIELFVKDDDNNCLDYIVQLLKPELQCTPKSPVRLTCGNFEFIHSLWSSHQQSVIVFLKEKKDFWKSITYPLLKEFTQTPQSEENICEINIVAYSLRIIANEIYYEQRSKKNCPELIAEIKKIIDSGKVLYWFKYICENCMGVVAIECCIRLLISVRQFVVVTSTCFVSSSSSSSKSDLAPADERMIAGGLDSLMKAVFIQFELKELKKENLKFSVISCGLYIDILKNLKTYKFSEHCTNLEILLSLILNNGSRDLQSLLTVVSTSILFLIQKNKHQLVSHQEILLKMFNTICSHLQCNANLLQIHKIFDNELLITIHILLTCIFVELLPLQSDVCVNHIRRCTIIMDNSKFCNYLIKSGKNHKLLTSLVILFISLAQQECTANVLLNSKITTDISTIADELYYTKKNNSTIPVPQISSEKLNIYTKILLLEVTMLKTLGLTYLQRSLVFIDIHSDRIIKSLTSIDQSLLPREIAELQNSLNLICQLMKYRHHLHDNNNSQLDNIMFAVCSMFDKCCYLLNNMGMLEQIVMKTNLMYEYESTLNQKDCCTSGVKVKTLYLDLCCQVLQILSSHAPSFSEIIMDHDLQFVNKYLDTGDFKSLSYSSETAVPMSTPFFYANYCIKNLTQSDSLPSTLIESLNFGLERSVYVIVSHAILFLRNESSTLDEINRFKVNIKHELNNLTLLVRRQMRRSLSLTNTKQTSKNLFSSQNNVFNTIDLFTQLI